MPVSASLYAGVKAVESGAADLGTPSITHDTGSKQIDWTNGTLADQADRIWSDVFSIPASGNTDLDLAGALTGALGGTVTFAKIKAIYLEADRANANNIVVGAAASNPFLGPFGAATHTLAVPPGGRVMLTAPVGGWAVTAGTGDLLRLANSGAGTAVNGKIVLIGTSA
ncbi:hypothetical protein [Blastochloris tepida]|uniref:Uncharacterized protein n=1 Tax=Blastochloris tepida TaxID=2233851 RepID=A0A348G1E1_9HYPH|nr:hypothetical protein [Blastochloris tepida]BBF93374.1 hypothetical protein BLTE_20590 [Blastochloris tepida]